MNETLPCLKQCDDVSTGYALSCTPFADKMLEKATLFFFFLDRLHSYIICLGESVCLWDSPSNKYIVGWKNLNNESRCMHKNLKSCSRFSPQQCTQDLKWSRSIVWNLGGVYFVVMTDQICIISLVAWLCSSEIIIYFFLMTGESISFLLEKLWIITVLNGKPEDLTL